MNRTLPCFLDLAERRQGLVDDLRHLHELDVVAEHDVEVVDAHPVQADVDALDDPPGREVEVGLVVAAELGPEEVAVARDAPERHAEQALAEPSAVERRGVDEVHARGRARPGPTAWPRSGRPSGTPAPATTRRSSTRANPGRSGPEVGFSTWVASSERARIEDPHPNETVGRIEGSGQWLVASGQEYGSH